MSWDLVWKLPGPRLDRERAEAAVRAVAAEEVITSALVPDETGAYVLIAVFDVPRELVAEIENGSELRGPGNPWQGDADEYRVEVRFTEGPDGAYFVVSSKLAKNRDVPETCIELGQALAAKLGAIYIVDD